MTVQMPPLPSFPRVWPEFRPHAVTGRGPGDLWNLLPRRAEGLPLPPLWHGRILPHPYWGDRFQWARSSCINCDDAGSVRRHDYGEVLFEGRPMHVYQLCVRCYGAPLLRRVFEAGYLEAPIYGAKCTGLCLRGLRGWQELPELGELARTAARLRGP